MKKINCLLLCITTPKFCILSFVDCQEQSNLKFQMLIEINVYLDNMTIKLSGIHLMPTKREIYTQDVVLMNG